MHVIFTFIFVVSLIATIVLFLLGIIKKLTHKGPQKLKKKFLKAVLVAFISMILMEATEPASSTSTSSQPTTVLTTEAASEVTTVEAAQPTTVAETTTVAVTEAPTQPTTSAPTTQSDAEDSFLTEMSYNVYEDPYEDTYYLEMSFRNNTDKTIKYLKFSFDYINRVGDVVTEDGMIMTNNITGPIAPGEVYNSQTELDDAPFDIETVRFDSVDVEYMDGTKDSMYLQDVD